MRPQGSAVAGWANLHTTPTWRSPVRDVTRREGGQPGQGEQPPADVSRAPTRNGARRPGGCSCHAAGATPAVGDEVHAHDGALGRVALVLRSETAVPRFIVVATGRLRRRYPVLACGLITQVDGRLVRVRGRRRELRDLPEDLPIVV